MAPVLQDQSHFHRVDVRGVGGNQAPHGINGEAGRTAGSGRRSGLDRAVGLVVVGTGRWVAERPGLETAADLIELLPGELAGQLPAQDALFLLLVHDSTSLRVAKRQRSLGLTPLYSKTQMGATSSSPPRPAREDRAGVVTAEAEGIVEGDADLAPDRLAEREVDVAGRIALRDVDGRRHDAVDEAEDRGDRLDGRGGSQEMAGHALGRGGGEAACMLIASTSSGAMPDSASASSIARRMPSPSGCGAET